LIQASSKYCKSKNEQPNNKKEKNEASDKLAYYFFPFLKTGCKGRKRRKHVPKKKEQGENPWRG